MQSGAQGRSTSDRPWKARAASPTLVGVAALVALVSSLGAPLIPSIARADHVSLSEAEWLLTATLMTGACATPVLGRLADGPRVRMVLVVTLGVVSAGCALSALSTTFLTMVLGRGLQGFGLGLLPVTMAMARRHLPLPRVKQVVATLSVTAAVGAGLGYPLTSLIAQVLNVRAAFWFGAITVGLAVIVVLAVLPATSDAPSRKLDLPGAATLGLAVVGISLVLSEGGRWGWTSARALGTFAGAGVLLAVWIWREVTTPDPLIDVRQVRNRPVLTADVSGFLMAASMYLFVPIVVEYVQIPRATGYGFGASVVDAGLVLVPLSAGSFLASRCLVAFERRFSARTIIPFGSLLFGASSLLFALEHRAFWEAFVVSAIAGLGMGFTFAAMPGLIVRAVPAGETGSAMGFYQVWRGVGLSVGSALAAAILTADTPAGQVVPHIAGFRDTLFIASGLGLVSAVLGYLLPGAIPQPALPHVAPAQAAAATDSVRFEGPLTPVAAPLALETPRA